MAREMAAYTEAEVFALARYMYLLGREHGQDDRTVDLDAVDDYTTGELAAIRGGRRERQEDGGDGG